MLNSNTVAEDPEIAAAGPGAARHGGRLRQLRRRHLDRGDVGDAARSSRTPPIIDFINYVQARRGQGGPDRVADADLPVLSIAAPFNRAASFPQGNVTVRDVAGLYIFDNTLLGSRVTGAQVKDYLEFSAQLLQAGHDHRPGRRSPSVTNAVTPTAPNGTPDYNYDIVAGLDAPLTYDIDLAKPVGSRITNLPYGGAPSTRPGSS